MRIRAIRGAGLASLEAAFELNLDDEPVRSAGIFVIGGPTGAGKSTILDALCLALFDRAPRLERAPRTVSTNTVSDDVIRPSDPRSIVRRGASLAYAEVDFTGKRGGAYRARWEVKTSKRRDGTRVLGKQSMTLVRLEDAQPLLQKRGEGQRIGTTKTDVLREVEQRLGLDYGQFCRSVLLPQGDLASFLEVPDDERARLLERVTGTEIYSRLSQTIHVRASTLQRALRDQTQALQNIQVLDAVSRTTLEQSASVLALNHARAQRRLAELGDAQRWHETRRVLREEAREAERMLAEVQSQLSLWETRRFDITLAKSLRELRPLRREAETKSRALTALRAQAPRIQQALLSAREALARAQQALSMARAAQLHFEEAHRIEDAAIQHHETAMRALMVREERVSETRRSLAVLQKAELEATQRERDAEKQDAVCARERKQTTERLDAHPEPPVDALAELLRRALHEGDACPVCGSVEHPGAHDARAPSTRGGAVELAQALEARRALESKQQQLAIEHERARATLSARREDHARRTEERVRVEAEFKEASEALGVEREGVARVHGAETPSVRRERLQTKERGLRAASELASRSFHEAEARLGVDAAAAQMHAASEAQLAKEESAARIEWEQALSARALREADVARLDGVTDAEIDSWSLELARLDRMLLEHSAVAEERRRRRDALEHGEDPAMKGDTKEAIDAAMRKLEPEVAALAESRAETQAKLSEDDARRELHRERHAQLEQLSVEAQTWDSLTRAMGSADGKKLRVLVQSIALDVLVAHANRHLDTLAPRYQLVRRTESSLGLDVIDHELACFPSGKELDPTPRSTSSLSGGERFQVSLALALGLGSMTAEREDVGTLFLDEGFGALDEQSLEQALEVLDALHQAGRQIGIVSHVARIAERFDVRVDVSPTSAGSSTVSLRAG